VDDVWVLLEVRVQDDLHLDLPGREAALLKGMFLVYEFDGDDGLGCIYGYGFADGSVGALADCFADEAEGQVCGQGSDLTLCSC
jgi:hypothetical protein